MKIIAKIRFINIILSFHNIQFYNFKTPIQQFFFFFLDCKEKNPDKFNIKSEQSSVIVSRSSNFEKSNKNFVDTFQIHPTVQKNSTEKRSCEDLSDNQVHGESS